MKLQNLKSKKFLVLGAYGMAGSMISNYLLLKKYDVTTIVRLRENIFPVEIIWNNSNFQDLSNLISNNFDYVINCIGILNRTNLSKIEIRKINTELPLFLNNLSKNNNFKLIHLSTDCVFSGESEEPYFENSKKDGVSIYDKSKSDGEFLSSKNLIFRSSIIGPELKKNGIGLLNWFLNSNKQIDGYDNWYWSGITTLTLAKAIEASCHQSVTGIIHLNNGSKISKYQLLKLIKTQYNLKIIIKRKKNPNGMNKYLKSSRTDFVFFIPNYKLMIRELILYTSENKIYQNYFFL